MTIGPQDETRVQCPLCLGHEYIETRQEDETMHRVYRVDCWLCSALGSLPASVMRKWRNAGAPMLRPDWW